MTLFADDSVVPAQYHAYGYDAPEKALLRAVFENALADLSRAPSTRRSARLWLEAEAWLESDDLWLYSFLNICEILALDPGAVRTAVRRMTAGFHDVALGYKPYKYKEEVSPRAPRRDAKGPGECLRCPRPAEENKQLCLYHKTKMRERARRWYRRTRQLPLDTPIRPYTKQRAA